MAPSLNPFRFTPLIFSGSKRHMMGEIFSSPARPFYQSASTISLRPISLDSYTSFITRHFASKNVKIEPETVQYIYNKFEGTTWYIQKICNELFAMSDPHSNCGVEEVDVAIKCAVEEKDDVYQDMMARLSSRQKILLLALAHSHGNVQPTSGSFIKKFNLTSASSVQRNLIALQEKDIITNSSGQYRIYDYFLNFWLNKE